MTQRAFSICRRPHSSMVFHLEPLRVPMKIFFCTSWLFSDLERPDTLPKTTGSARWDTFYGFDSGGRLPFRLPVGRRLLYNVHGRGASSTRPGTPGSAPHRSSARCAAVPLLRRVTCPCPSRSQPSATPLVTRGSPTRQQPWRCRPWSESPSAPHRCYQRRPEADSGATCPSHENHRTGQPPMRSLVERLRRGSGRVSMGDV